MSAAVTPRKASSTSGTVEAAGLRSVRPATSSLLPGSRSLWSAPFAPRARSSAKVRSPSPSPQRLRTCSAKVRDERAASGDVWTETQPPASRVGSQSTLARQTGEAVLFGRVSACAGKPASNAGTDAEQRIADASQSVSRVDFESVHRRASELYELHRWPFAGTLLA